MTASPSKWFYRGREARGHGQARELPDGRISPASRAEWFAGWDAEDRLRLQLTPEAAAKSNALLAKLRDFAASL
jgi:hypothetical protein